MVDEEASGINHQLSIISRHRIRSRYASPNGDGHGRADQGSVWRNGSDDWFEQARGAWCRERGFTYKSLEEQGLLLPVVEAHLRYRGEVKYDDWVVVRVSLAETKRAAMKFDYQVFNETTGKVTTEGYTWHVVVSAEARKAISIPPNMRALLERDPAEFKRLD